MAAQNLVQQTIQFTTTGSFDDNILASPYIQNVAANSQSQIITLTYNSGYHWNGTVFETGTNICNLQCYVTNQFQAQIQQTLGQLQAQFPRYNVSTYGINVSYGN